MLMTMEVEEQLEITTHSYKTPIKGLQLYLRVKNIWGIIYRAHQLLQFSRGTYYVSMHFDIMK